MKKRKKVLHLLPSNSFSGAENVVCTIIENDSSYDMYYCCPKGPIEQILKERNIKYIPIKKLTPKNLKKICIDNDINVIHAHDFKASFVAGITKLNNVKKISHIHCNPDFIKKLTPYSILYSYITRYFYKIAVVSDEIIQEAIFKDMIKDKSLVIRNVVDKKRVIKKSKEFKTSKYDLIYVGRLIDVKQPEIIIEVTKQLVKKYPNFKACIIGTGNLESKCKELINNYGIEKNVDMLGFVANPFPYISNSKVAMLPSLHEGLPMSVVECMILNVPVLNSGVDGMKTLFQKHPKFICNDVNDYVTKIEDILNGNDLLTNQCQTIIEDYTNIDNYIEKVNKLYE